MNNYWDLVITGLKILFVCFWVISLVCGIPFFIILTVVVNPLWLLAFLIYPFVIALLIMIVEDL